MPMYEYACEACGHQDTLLEKMQASRAKKCPACGQARGFRRQLSAPSFQLKGSGWYVTDFRDNGKAKPDAKPAAKADDASKKDSKPAKDKPAAASDSAKAPAT